MFTCQKLSDFSEILRKTVFVHFSALYSPPLYQFLNIKVTPTSHRYSLFFYLCWSHLCETCFLSASVCRSGWPQGWWGGRQVSPCLQLWWETLSVVYTEKMMCCRVVNTQLHFMFRLYPTDYTVWCLVSRTKKESKASQVIVVNVFRHNNLVYMATIPLQKINKNSGWGGRLKKWNFPEPFTWCVTHIRLMCFMLCIVLFVCVCRCMCNLNQEMSNVQETTDTLALHATNWHLRWYLLASTNSTDSTGQANTGIQPERTEKRHFVHTKDRPENVDHVVAFHHLLQTGSAVPEGFLFFLNKCPASNFQTYRHSHTGASQPVNVLANSLANWNRSVDKMTEASHSMWYLYTVWKRVA